MANDRHARLLRARVERYETEARQAAARIAQLEAVESAARNLIAGVRRRYPGEELRCEYMRALDAALKDGGE